MCVTRLAHTCNTTHSYVWHGPLPRLKPRTFSRSRCNTHTHTLALTHPSSRPTPTHVFMSHLNQGTRQHLQRKVARSAQQGSHVTHTNAKTTYIYIYIHTYICMHQSCELSNKPELAAKEPCCGTGRCTLSHKVLINYPNTHIHESCESSNEPYCVTGRRTLSHELPQHTCSCVV